MHTSRARKEHRKFPFLKAYALLGSIRSAAKRTRISRDAVHDWLRKDASFCRAFANAKKQFENQEFAGLESALVFFTHIVRPIIPKDCWPRIASELAIGMSNLKNDLKGGRRYAVPLTGEVAEVSLSRDGSKGVTVHDRDIENSAHDL